MSGPILEAEGVSRRFVVGRNWLGQESRTVRAVHEVTFSLQAGQSLALVGESGCGKSTLARMLVGLDTPSGGCLRLLGTLYPRQPHRRRLSISPKVQIVFQDPKSSFNPRKTAEQALLAPLKALTNWSQQRRLERVREVLALVELTPQLLTRYPHELSGGQAQRLAIARALGPEPDVLVLDEALSALDVSVQARLLRLLDGLRKRLNLSYVFISHDLAVVEVLCDQLAVMYLGSIVEMGPTQSILKSPRHPYTRALLSAVPVIGASSARIPLYGDPPSPAQPPSGCAFHTRCYRAEALCANEAPRLADGRVDHPCACFFAHDSAPR